MCIIDSLAGEKSATHKSTFYRITITLVDLRGGASAGSYDWLMNAARIFKKCKVLEHNQRFQ
jgi:hypothetical protein